MQFISQKFTNKNKEAMMELVTSPLSKEAEERIIHILSEGAKEKPSIDRYYLCLLIIPCILLATHLLDLLGIARIIYLVMCIMLFLPFAQYTVKLMNFTQHERGKTREINPKHLTADDLSFLKKGYKYTTHIHLFSIFLGSAIISYIFGLAPMGIYLVLFIISTVLWGVILYHMYKYLEYYFG